MPSGPAPCRWWARSRSVPSASGRLPRILPAGTKVRASACGALDSTSRGPQCKRERLRVSAHQQPRGPPPWAVAQERPKPGPAAGAPPTASRPAPERDNQSLRSVPIAERPKKRRRSSVSAACSVEPAGCVNAATAAGRFRHNGTQRGSDMFRNRCNREGRSNVTRTTGVIELWHLPCVSSPVPLDPGRDETFRAVKPFSMWAVEEESS